MGRSDFINSIYRQGLELAKKYPINAAIMTAQAILESRYGESKLAKEANNLFGIKAFSSWKGERYTIKTKEWKDNLEYTIEANFRKYRTVNDCLMDYCKLISKSKYYIKARTNADNYIAYAQGLRSWATDPKYISKLINLAEKLNLVNLPL
jgi:N-acetylmuramoyl-L-alanine amidase